MDMFKKLMGKGKVVLDKEDFRIFFFTFLDKLSKEWKEITDKRIKTLEEANNHLIKENRNLNKIYNKFIQQSNTLIRALDTELSTLRTHIFNLEIKLKEVEE